MRMSLFMDSYPHLNSYLQLALTGESQMPLLIVFSDCSLKLLGRNGILVLLFKDAENSTRRLLCSHTNLFL